VSLASVASVESVESVESVVELCADVVLDDFESLEHDAPINTAPSIASPTSCRVEFILPLLLRRPTVVDQSTLPVPGKRLLNTPLSRNAPGV